MNKIIRQILAILTIASGICPIGFNSEAAAEVNVAVNIGPPVIMVDEPPEVVFAPAYGVYFVPDMEHEIFFYNGFWWSRRGSYWYRSRFYRTGWAVARERDVPRPVFRTPRDYRERYTREPRIRYQDWKERPARQENRSLGRGDAEEKTQKSGDNSRRGGYGKTGRGGDGKGDGRRR